MVGAAGGQPVAPGHNRFARVHCSLDGDRQSAGRPCPGYTDLRALGESPVCPRPKCEWHDQSKAASTSALMRSYSLGLLGMLWKMIPSAPASS